MNQVPKVLRDLEEYFKLTRESEILREDYHELRNLIEGVSANVMELRGRDTKNEAAFVDTEEIIALMESDLEKKFLILKRQAIVTSKVIKALNKKGVFPHVSQNQ